MPWPETNSPRQGRRRGERKRGEEGGVPLPGRKLLSFQGASALADCHILVASHTVRQGHARRVPGNHYEYRIIFAPKTTWHLAARHQPTRDSTAPGATASLDRRALRQLTENSASRGAIAPPQLQGKKRVHGPIAGRWLATTVGLSILSSAKNLELDKEPTVVKAGL
jgi:hypothetical protein